MFNALEQKTIYTQSKSLFGNFVENEFMVLLM